MVPRRWVWRKLSGARQGFGCLLQPPFDHRNDMQQHATTIWKHKGCRGWCNSSWWRRRWWRGWWSWWVWFCWYICWGDFKTTSNILNWRVCWSKVCQVFGCFRTSAMLGSATCSVRDQVVLLGRRGITLRWHVDSRSADLRLGFDVSSSWFQHLPTWKDKRIQKVWVQLS